MLYLDLSAQKQRIIIASGFRGADIDEGKDRYHKTEERKDMHTYMYTHTYTYENNNNSNDNDNDNNNNSNNNNNNNNKTFKPICSPCEAEDDFGGWHL